MFWYAKNIYEHTYMDICIHVKIFMLINFMTQFIVIMYVLFCISLQKKRSRRWGEIVTVKIRRHGYQEIDINNEKKDEKLHQKPLGYRNLL